MKARLFLASIALLAARATAAGDCLAPLAANPGWACHADVSNGQAVDFCLQHTHTLGDDPAFRFFKMKSAGPHAMSCSCGAKGKSPGAAFGVDKTYLCLDRETDTVVSGKISNRKIAGQTFDVGAGVRSTFACAPNPICTVPPIVDHDLPADQGSVDLPPPPGQSRTNVVAAGSIDVGYLGGGCSGYATEAPTFTYDVEATVPGSILFFFSHLTIESRAAGLLVMSPSGEARCADKELAVPLESGTYAVWMRSLVPGGTAEVELVGTYIGQ